MAIFMQTFMPVWYLRLVSQYSQSRRMVHARHTAELANDIARELISMKTEALTTGKERKKDVLSLLGEKAIGLHPTNY
jgi:hypothetical protein